MAMEISAMRYEDVRKQIGHYAKMDYHPEIRPAGTVILEDGLETCFKDYKLQDSVDALKSKLHITDKREDYGFNHQLPIGTADLGTHTGVKTCLEMTKRTPFQLLICELRDTAMNSYWKKEVGKTSGQKSNLPNGVDPVTTIFGKRTMSNGTAAELVNPQKTVTEVILASRIGHRLYRKSHNNYDVSEQINRKYVEPFNKNYKYGKKNRIDKEGSQVKQSMRWFKQDVASIVSNLQADFIKRTHAPLGRSVCHTPEAY
ncbi:EF-hand domain-containing family member B-like [Neodiprion virginianus]|uniref:EF-hand domain-containing family member B-like n=1 Tax=Neodiprion virginianus TaxID=2961670 RepID=UPI001EE700EA|nr:EF-hand domain-containing family member B-like [Neodiprion virginianus]